MATNRPVVLPPCSPSDMISYALQHPGTTIMICSTRSAFLNSLASSVCENPESHLLHATLHQIASSRSTTLAFLQTISHLRAYLAVFQPKTTLDTPASMRSDTRKPLLLVYGLLNLHRDTSEWSAQGLGITMASLVEAGSRHSCRIVMCEEDVEEDLDIIDAITIEEETGDLQREERDEMRKSNCWHEAMPILNGSTRRLVDEEAGWAGRTVEVGRVLQRWCLFQEG